jgi:hypothetical protein
MEIETNCMTMFFGGNASVLIRVPLKLFILYPFFRKGEKHRVGKIRNIIFPISPIPPHSRELFELSNNGTHNSLSTSKENLGSKNIKTISLEQKIASSVQELISNLNARSTPPTSF